MSINDRTVLPMSDYYDTICNSKGSSGLTIRWGQTIERTSNRLKNVGLHALRQKNSQTTFGGIDGD